LVTPKGAIILANSIVLGFGMIGGGVVGPVLIGVLSGPSFLGTLDLTFLVLSGVGTISLAFLPFLYQDQEEPSEEDWKWLPS